MNIQVSEDRGDNNKKYTIKIEFMTINKISKKVSSVQG
jgi:hypothetical protein